MINSMTGFGQAQVIKGGERFTVTLRSVNHRYFETSFHLPPALEQVESFLRSRIRAKVKRGRVTVSIHYANFSPETVVLNEPLVRRYYKTLNALRRDLKLSEPIELSALVSLPGVLRSTQQVLGFSEQEVLVKRALSSALAKLFGMRRREGRALEVDLRSRISRIRRGMATIKKQTRQVVRAQKKLLPPLEWEAFLRSRDAAEEITRIDFHLGSFIKHLHPNEAKGKILDFVSQELQREVNTLAAKAQDKHVIYQAVMIKDQIEKIREQVQNVE